MTSVTFKVTKLNKQNNKPALILRFIRHQIHSTHFQVNFEALSFQTQTTQSLYSFFTLKGGVKDAFQEGFYLNVSNWLQWKPNLGLFLLFPSR